MPSVGANTQKLSPRVQNAIRLLKSGAAKTQKEAAEAVGLAPQYMPGVLQSPAAKDYIQDLDEKLDARAVDVNSAIATLGFEAVKTLSTLMRHSENQGVRLRAATELLDRNPLTAKTQKHQVESLNIPSKDARAIAEAMVESARLRQQFIRAAEGDYIEITEAKPKELPHATDG